MKLRTIGLVILLALPLTAALSLPSCRAQPAAKHPRVIVIGFDGFDPGLAERLMDAGDLPNLARLRAAGGYRRLGTSVPPQSPVAWASFITGCDPGTHGIFDFIHRDPSRQYSPYYSAAETIESDDGWEVGDHRIPLTFPPFNHNPTQTLLKRDGIPFWDYLDAAGIPSFFYDLPANYPPSPSKHGHHCCLSGMGVPDLLGSYGTYQHYSARQRMPDSEPGGRRWPLRFRDNAAEAKLEGPLNTLLRDPQPSELPFVIHRHPSQPLARIEIQDHTVVLREGEWSEWLRVRFPLTMPSFLPDDDVPGVLRFYLQQVRPNFRLYVTPVNIDPSEPAQPISEPPDLVTEVAQHLGLFYTTGFQEDHNALTNRVFTDQEYRRQAEHVLEERLRLLDYALAKWQDGLLFFYFSSSDLQAHMFWWEGEEKHPLRSAEDARKYMGVLEDLYRRLDGVVGRLLDAYGDQATILVMSDHGFANFQRQFGLNSWLRDNGYIHPPDCRSLMGADVDWSRTTAYGLGLNALYVNLKGREKHGCVDPEEKDALLEELRQKLLAVRDPVTGAAVLSAVYRADEVYHGPNAARAPDLIIGYRRGYRASWATTLGDMTDPIHSDNDSAWSADHCIATEEVPGVLFANRPIHHPSPSLIDVAPTLLEEFGLRPPETMPGRNVFAVPGATSGLARKE